MGCRDEIAECLGLDRELVFWLEWEGTSRTEVAIWISGLTGAEIDRCMKLKPEIKAIGSRYGSKVFFSHRHPDELDLKKRRCKRGHPCSLTPATVAKYRKWNWDKQKGRCLWCNQDVPIRAATLEHIVPLSAGGKDEPENFAMSCGPCNWSRAKTPRIVVYLKLLMFRAKMGLRARREGELQAVRYPLPQKGGSQKHKKGARRPLYRPKSYPDERERDAMIETLRKMKDQWPKG